MNFIIIIIIFIFILEGVSFRARLRANRPAVRMGFPFAPLHSV